jgi:hypothetical protein
MRRSRIITAGIALAAVATVGGVTAAAAAGSPASSAPRRHYIHRTRGRPGRRGGNRAHRPRDSRRPDRGHPGQRAGTAPVLQQVIGAQPAVAAAARLLGS